MRTWPAETGGYCKALLRSLTHRIRKIIPDKGCVVSDDKDSLPACQSTLHTTSKAPGKQNDRTTDGAVGDAEQAEVGLESELTVIMSAMATSGVSDMMRMAGEVEATPEFEPSAADASEAPSNVDIELAHSDIMDSSPLAPTFAELWEYAHGLVAYCAGLCCAPRLETHRC